ncbi:Vacuolar protein sorting-associated protein 54 [Trichinella murrelli]|uniref:Vacuolar protein sorting-associated protein 54 n=1 Tax=Trichinella murrelli TaxID=144512 RepID=A0A0V0TKH0_9BILA|nr:Vacuolar protein sorting-associated protein 54 [Trichinella murrelli]
MSNVSTSKILPYASCLLCRQSGRAEFKSAAEFIDHLRTMHCTKEGGSYICHAALNVVKQRVLLRYGPYNVCRSLPVEGVADKDYEEHIRKVHLPDDGKEELGEIFLCPLNNRINWQCYICLAKLLQSMRFTENVSTSNQPSLVQDSIQPKNVYSLAQNLSAALNDPRKPRHLTSQFFTRHWGESFVETAEPPPLYNHRAVTWKNVESYMNEICPIFTVVFISIACLVSLLPLCNGIIGAFMPNVLILWPIVAPRHRRHLKDERKILKRFKKSQSVSGESEIATSTLNIPELFCSSSFCLKNVTCFNALIQLAEQSSQDGKASANLVGFPKEWTASLLTEQSLRSYKLFQEKVHFVIH